MANDFATMANETKESNAKNSSQQEGICINEKILKECHELYVNPKKGLIPIANQFGLKLLAPRKKITILLMGNHSAGKSSFINWYINEHVQKTGVAIETQGICIVTSGKKRESLTGNATMHLYPYFKPLQDMPGVLDFLSTEISTSNQRKFNLITFVDTPGLVDGDMVYLFDVNETILWLGGMSDLIFVFFDPIGQALCKRTLDIVEKLNAKHAEKIRFYLSKSDDAGNECDRQRVMMQIVQELCKRPGLNRTGFDMPTIFVPELNRPTKCTNQIEEICTDVEKTINKTVQKTLDSLEKNCDQITALVQEQLDIDEKNKEHNYNVVRSYILIGSYAAIIAVPFCINILVSAFNPAVFNSLAGDEVTGFLDEYLSIVRLLWSIVPNGLRWNVFLFFIVGPVVIFYFIQPSLERKQRLSRKQRNSYLQMRDYIQKVVVPKKTELYWNYLHQSVGDHDLSN